MPKFTITTSIFYPNAKPHMGHALEWVQADFLARYYRQKGHDVYFQVGLDEHGLKMQNAAAAANQTPLDFVAGQLGIFVKLAKELNVSHDRFIRTTDPDHQVVAQALWRACEDRGDIYSKTYRAWYNIKQEEFLGLADEHPDPSVFGVDEKHLELIEEENYFFRLSKYTDEVVELLKSGEYTIYPKHRMQELVQFVKEKGLQDVSISRHIDRLSWGVQVPHDKNHVMYVWFDALANYLTGCAEPLDGGLILNDFWPADLHCIGKDISRFHGLLWPAMLLSAGLPVPKGMLVHGFVLKDGHVMSKSKGNVIDPHDALAVFGTDALRWFFLSALPTYEDGNFTLERLAEVYAADLSNNYGNLVSRVLTMCHKYTNGQVPEIDVENHRSECEAVVTKAWELYDKEVTKAHDIQAALAVPKQLLDFANRLIEEQKPWEMARDRAQRKELDALLYDLLEIVRAVTAMMWPAIPDTAQRVAKELFFSLPGEVWQDSEQVRKWSRLRSGDQLGTLPFILFPRQNGTNG
jgi:methionyl-tRNA synthetase